MNSQKKNLEISFRSPQMSWHLSRLSPPLQPFTFLHISYTNFKNWKSNLFFYHFPLQDLYCISVTLRVRDFYELALILNYNLHHCLFVRQTKFQVINSKWNFQSKTYLLLDIWGFISKLISCSWKQEDYQ